MSNYIEYVAQDRRLMALRILRGIPERRANHFVLRSVLASTGYEELAPTVHNDLLWLAKQGLVLTEELDGGPVILQAKVPVFDGDDEDEITSRVQVQEHAIYPLVVGWFLDGRLKMQDNHAWIDGVRLPPAGYAADE